METKGKGGWVEGGGWWRHLQELATFHREFLFFLATLHSLTMSDNGRVSLGIEVEVDGLTSGVMFGLFQADTIFNVYRFSCQASYTAEGI